MLKINETLTRDPQKVWQTLKKFDYPININGPSYRLKDQMQHLTEERSEKIQNKNVGFST